jgi:hypothetical protein
VSCTKKKRELDIAGKLMKIVCEQLRALAGQFEPGIEAKLLLANQSSFGAGRSYDTMGFHRSSRGDPDESTSGRPTSQVFMLFYLLAKHNNS